MRTNILNLTKSKVLMFQLNIIRQSPGVAVGAREKVRTQVRNRRKISDIVAHA